MKIIDQQLQFEHGGALIHLPPHTIVENWLESINQIKPEQKTFKIGESIAEIGGIYVGMMRGNKQTDYHLVASEAEGSDLTWGPDDEEIEGADDEWDGQINTKALRQSEFDHPAAQWCADLNIEGFNDFYLPSRRELALCYANVPDLFAKVWHWSSTQYSGNSAWFQYFATGYQYGDRKGHRGRVRAVRRFNLSI